VAPFGAPRAQDCRSRPLGTSAGSPASEDDCLRMAPGRGAVADASRGQAPGAKPASPIRFPGVRRVRRQLLRSKPLRYLRLRMASGSRGGRVPQRTSRRAPRPRGTGSRCCAGVDSRSRRRALRNRASRGAHLGFGAQTLAPTDARLREIDRELANLARFAAKTGQVDTAAELYAELQGERAQIAARIGEVASDFDLGVVRDVVLERVRQMRAAFDGSDADRRWRVSSSSHWNQNESPEEGTSRRLACLVAGGRSVRLPTRGITRLQPSMLALLSTPASRLGGATWRSPVHVALETDPGGFVKRRGGARERPSIRADDDASDTRACVRLVLG